MDAAPARGEAFREALLREQGTLDAAEARDARQTRSLKFAARKARHAVHA